MEHHKWKPSTFYLIQLRVPAVIPEKTFKATTPSFHSIYPFRTWFYSLELKSFYTLTRKKSYGNKLYSHMIVARMEQCVHVRAEDQRGKLKDFQQEQHSRGENRRRVIRKRHIAGMMHDEKERRRQRAGSLPVNQITSQSFDRGLLWPEAWRITFAPARVYTPTDALRVTSTRLHGDKCVSLTSSLVLSARIRPYQHSCMCFVWVWACAWVWVSESVMSEWWMDDNAHFPPLLLSHNGPKHFKV